MNGENAALPRIASLKLYRPCRGRGRPSTGDSPAKIHQPKRSFLQASTDAQKQATTVTYMPICTGVTTKQLNGGQEPPCPNSQCINHHNTKQAWGHTGTQTSGLQTYTLARDSQLGAPHPPHGLAHGAAGHSQPAAQNVRGARAKPPGCHHS